MYPIYVLEGPDGSGKTTLGEFLAKKFSAHYMHLTYRFKDRMFTYHAAALDRAIRLSKTRPVIIDRWWPSINIYDDVFRKRRTFPVAHRMLDRAGMASGVIYISCMPSDYEAFLKSFEERKAAGGEMYDSVVEVAHKYGDWAYKNRKRVDMIQYDRFTDGKDMDEFALKVRARWLQVNNRIPPWFWQNRMFAGNSFTQPKFMIVGERSNPKGRHQLWPFFEYANSSLWLTEVLEETGIQEYDIVWANAIDSDGWTQPTKLEKMWCDLKPQHLIALGNKAERVLMAAGLYEFTTRLPHPAYVKRFQQGASTDYLNTFKEML